MIKAIHRITNNKRLSELLSRPKHFRILLASIIGLLLIIIYNTPFGDHGFSDTSRINLSNKAYIHDLDGTIFTLQNSDNENKVLFINEFEIIDNQFVVGNTFPNPFEKTIKDYFYFHSETDSVMSFQSEQDYISFAKEHSLPMPNSFKTYYEHFKKEWGIKILFIL